MIRSTNITTAALLFTLALTACGKKSTEVQSHSPELQKQIGQNLENGRLPRADEVANGAVPAAANACEKFRARIPKDFIQDFIQVPEDPANPSGQKIKVFYFGKVIPNSVPIFFINGGPLSSSHGSMNAIRDAQYLFDQNSKLGFIFVDQRGTGCSDFYPQGNTVEILQRLTHYGSTGIVNDYELIRKKLIGDNKIIAFGQSYGAFVAHRYATLFPQSLKADFAHGGTITNDGYDRFKKRIESQIRVSEIYFSQYPGDREKINSLKEYLASDRCFSWKDDSKQVRCGLEVIDEIAGDMLGFTDQWLTIHGWIGRMVQSNGISEEGINQFLATFAFSAANPLGTTGWADRVISYADRDVPGLTPATCEKIQADLAAQGVKLEEALMTQCGGPLQLKYQTTDRSILQKLTRDVLTLTAFTTSLKVNPSMNMYVYSGQKDAWVPVSTFEEERSATQGLPNFHYTNFLGTGHDGFLTEPLVWENLLKEATGS